ncbi:MAG: hypothetical protein ACM3JI_02175 [Anaerolineae bacterium]
MSSIYFPSSLGSRKEGRETSDKKSYLFENERVRNIKIHSFKPSTSQTFAKNRKPIKAITPIAAPPNFSKLPSISSVVGVFFEARSLYKAYKTRKYGNEGKLDAAMRLGAAPISWTNAALSIINMVPTLAPFVHFLLPLSNQLLPAASTLLKVTNILGIILCTIEAIGELIYLKRVVVFSKKFHADSLKGLFEDIKSKDLKKRVEILERWRKKLEEDPHFAEKFQLPFATTQEKQYAVQLIKELRESLNDALRAYKKGRRADRRYDKDVAPKLLALEEKLLKRDLKRLNEEYLRISSKELKLIEKIVKKNFPTLTKEQRAEKVKQVVHEELEIKKIKFARRVGPWFVKELEDLPSGLLRGLRSKDPIEKEHAKILSKELTKDIQIQAKKKIIVHVVGLIALTLTISALVFSIIGIPYVTIPLLILGMVVAFLRYLLATGFLSTRGWAFDVKQTVSKRLSHFVEEVINPFKAYYLQSEKITFQAFYERHFTIDPKESLRLKELIIKQCPFWKKKKMQAKFDTLVDSTLYRKKKKLAKRVGVFLAQEIEDNIHSIAKNLTSRKAKKRQKARVEAAELLKTVHIQARKKILVHSVAIVALGLIGATAATFFLLNPYVALALALAALIFILMRVVLGKGLLNTKGWKFSFTETFPEAIAKRFAPPPGYVPS